MGGGCGLVPGRFTNCSMGIVRRHLVLKLGAVLLLTIGVGFTVPTVLNARFILSQMEKDHAQSASAIARSLAAGMRTAMLSGNSMTARELVRDVRRSVQGADVTIYAPNGEEVFGEHSGAPPDAVPDHVTKAMASRQPSHVDGVGSVLPLLNTERCRKCHEKGELRGVLTLSTSGAKRALPDTEAHAAVLAEVVTAAFIQLMTAEQHEQLDDYFNEIGMEVSGVEGVAVVDASATVTLGDTFIDLPTGQIEAALAEGTPRFVAPRAGKNRSAPRRSGSAKAAAAGTATGPRYILPLKNEKRCHACHDADPKIRGAVVVALKAESILGQAELTSTVQVALNHVMLSGLGRLMRRYLEAVAQTGAVAQLTLHDEEGRLYKDAFAVPTPPSHVAKALRSGRIETLARHTANRQSFTVVEPLVNEERCQRCHGTDHEVRGAIAVNLDTTEAAQSRMHLARTTSMYGLFTVLAVLTTLFLGLRLLVLRPVAEIGNVANQVAHGNLNAEVLVRSVDEIGRLGGRVNQMVVELRKKLALSKFVSGATVASIDQSKGEVQRKGQRIQVTVLFSDIRGFTAFSESRQPEEVVAMLNRYLDVQTQQVIAMGGDIDKFVGDELMAHFRGEDAERRAVEAAVRMIEAVEALNQGMRHDQHQVAVGVGINTGEVVFGAMGAENRMDFTVIGDAVNLGARLCSAAKPLQVLVSESTRVAAGDPPGFVFEELEPITVKGKQKPVRIYQARRA